MLVIRYFSLKACWVLIGVPLSSHTQITGIKFLSLRDNNVPAIEITDCDSKPFSVSRGGEGDLESEVLRRLCQGALLWPPAFQNETTLLAVVSCADEVHILHRWKHFIPWYLSFWTALIQLFIIWF